MPVTTEIARLRRAVDELVDGVQTDLRSKAGLSRPDRMALRRELEACIQLLDELRSSVAGG